MEDQTYNELYDVHVPDYDEGGELIEIERSCWGGRIEISGIVVTVVITRVELSLDPWHVAIIYGADYRQHGYRPRSCFVERFWDDTAAWQSVVERIHKHGIADL